MSLFRKALSAAGMLSSIHKVFSKIPDPRVFIKPPSIPIVDHFMAGLAVFGLKCTSLLDYDNKRSTEVVAKNLHDLYRISTPPSDTYLRERLDEVNPNGIRPAFKKIFAHFQRGKGLEEYEFLNRYVLLSGDGTGHFSSDKISCPQSCKKEHANGSVTHYHQLFHFKSIIASDKGCLRPNFFNANYKRQQLIYSNLSGNCWCGR